MICRKCEIDKDVDDFRECRPTKGSPYRVTLCIICERDYMKQNYRTNLMGNRLKNREIDRKYGRDKDQVNAAARERYHRNIEFMRLKRRARGRVYNALKAGKLSKPNECERCDIVAKLYSHHEDYTKPLEVEWLCGECHHGGHSELGVVHA